MAAAEFLLFVYGVMMRGEPKHGALARARALGDARTEPTFDLVDLGAEPALVPGGRFSVRGELYAVAAVDLAPIDVHHGHPLVYRRSSIRLDDGQTVEAHLIAPDQARARRRIRTADWRTRFDRSAGLPERAWTRFANERGRTPR